MDDAVGILVLAFAGQHSVVHPPAVAVRSLHFVFRAHKITVVKIMREYTVAFGVEDVHEDIEHTRFRNDSESSLCIYLYLIEAVFTEAQEHTGGLV